MKEEIKEITNKMIKTSQPNGVFLTAEVRDKIIYYINNSLEEIERLNNIIDDKKERQAIAIRLLHKLFGTDDYEINYIIGIINGQRQIKFDDEILDKEKDNE